MTRIVLFVAAVVAAVVAERPVPEGILWPYHEKVGIPAMARITQQEQARDFDGGRIIGGQAVNAGAHPYLGGIIIQLQNGNSICGSSLLTNTRALTAAHCWDDGWRVALGFTMVYGSSFWLTGGVRVPALEVIMHENWNTFNVNNDIAIIRHEWVGFNNVINRIHLPSGPQLSQTFVGAVAVASGFGQADVIPHPSNPQQREVVLEVISNAECLRTFNPINVVASTICTRGVRGLYNIGVCSGDSGGPLAVGSGDNRVLIGVVSFGSPRGCWAGDPDAYARVTSFVPWIQARL